MSLCGQMKRLIVAFALLPAIAQAHGGGGHLKGMLSAFDDQKLTILLDQKDKSIVGIDRETRFEQDNRAVELKNLVVGAQVVVHLRAGTKPPVAALVKLSVPTGSRVEISVTKDGFVIPRPQRLKAGQPVTLVVTRQGERTCATDIVLKDFGLSRPLPLQETVELSFTPSKAGKVRFACAMDMLAGELTVE